MRWLNQKFGQSSTSPVQMIRASTKRKLPTIFHKIMMTYSLYSQNLIATLNIGCKSQANLSSPAGPGPNCLRTTSSKSRGNLGPPSSGVNLESLHQSMIVYATFGEFAFSFSKVKSNSIQHVHGRTAWFLGCILGCVWPSMAPTTSHLWWISKAPGFEDIPEAYAAALHGHHGAQKVTRFSHYQGLSCGQRSQHELSLHWPLTSFFKILLTSSSRNFDTLHYAFCPAWCWLEHPSSIKS